MMCGIARLTDRKIYSGRERILVGLRQYAVALAEGLRDTFVSDPSVAGEQPRRRLAAYGMEGEKRGKLEFFSPTF
jgi:hypothetical protein